MGRGQDGAGRWWCGGWKSQELDDHVLLLARKPADWNKVKSEHGLHIRIHTTYNSIMFTYNICKPDDKRRVNTDQIRRA